nr:hypothetical protein [Celeribacter neptunius]
MDHPVSDLLGRPAVLEPLNDVFGEIWMLDQLALPSTAAISFQLRRRAIIARVFWQALVDKIVPL